MSTYRYFHPQQHGEIAEAILVEPVDADELLFNQLRDEIVEYVKKERPDKLLINFREFARASTAVINALLVVKKRVAQEGGELKLCDLSDNVRASYRLLNLDGTVFDIYDTQAEALTAF